MLCQTCPLVIAFLFNGLVMLYVSYTCISYRQCYCEKCMISIRMEKWPTSKRQNKLERFLQETSVQMIHLFYNSKNRLTYFIALYKDSNTWYWYWKDDLLVIQKKVIHIYSGTPQNRPLWKPDSSENRTFSFGSEYSPIYLSKMFL